MSQNINVFIKEPRKVIIQHGEDSQYICFIGNIPNNIIKAIHSNNTGLLTNFYGKNYEKILGFNHMKTGSDELDDINDELNREVKQKIIKKGEVQYETDVVVYPEDNLQELREKIQLVTGIPMFRQHLYYIHNEVTTSYKLILNGTYPININQIYESKDHIIGLPIDKKIYDNRKYIKIESLDTFQILGNIPTDTFYVVDIEHIIGNKKIQIRDLIADTYRFELLYYGLIIKYWPQFTLDCFKDYLMNDFADKYPDMHIDNKTLTNIYNSENKIIEAVYRDANKMVDISVSITRMLAMVSAMYTQINIRNLFDYLRVSRYIPEIHAYIEYNNMKYMLRKRHIRNGSDISFPTGTNLRQGITLAISLRYSDQKSFHARKSHSTFENEQSRYLFLNIRPDGTYYIKTFWNEEDEIEFDDIIDILAEFINPIIMEVNSLKKYVFVIGDNLPLIDKYTIKYHSLNVCVFWKKVITSDVYSKLTTMWSDYMLSKITALHSSIHTDRFEFLFRKGMYEYDPLLIYKVISMSTGSKLHNHYSRFSDRTIKTKWDQHYGGRLVCMYHRTTDVKFEIIDIGENELNIFLRYIRHFVIRAEQIETPTKIESSGNIKRLRKLKEQDPELYNLKKYGSKKVYSILCQNERQPLIYTDDELKKMSDKEKNKLAKYWNFTLNKPAYYNCPTKKYPHLSFIVGMHPKHYCLPCCNKKLRDNIDSKRADRDRVCMKEFKIDDYSVDSSYHIIKYGKVLDADRLSHLPKSGLFDLLGPTITENNQQYCLYGVPQHLPGIQNVGAVFSLAAALNTDIKSMMSFIINNLKSHATNFYVLLDGSITEYFNTVDELIGCIKDLFIDNKNYSTVNKRFYRWNEILIELICEYYSLNLFLINDRHLNGDFELYVDNPLKIRSDHFSVMIAKIVIKENDYWYPIFLLNPREYWKNKHINHRFCNKTLTELLFKMITNKNNTDNLLSYCINTGKQLIRHVGTRNESFAIMCDNVYVPIKSKFTADGIPISYELPVIGELSDTLQFIDTYNKQTNKIIVNCLLTYKNEVFGVLADDKIWYCKAELTQELTSNYKISQQQYNFYEVNRHIINKTPQKQDNRTIKLGKSLYDNYCYQLFLIEFAYYLESERNDDMRQKLYSIVNVDNARKNINQIRDNIAILLKKFKNDINVLNVQLDEFITGKHTKKILLNSISTTNYDFDKKTLNEIKKISGPELYNAVHQIAQKIAIHKDLSDNIKFPNVYIPCDVNPKIDYCHNKLLILNKPIEEYSRLLAADLSNNIKSKYILHNVWTEMYVDYFNFIVRLSDVINIYRLS